MCAAGVVLLLGVLALGRFAPLAYEGISCGSLIQQEPWPGGVRGEVSAPTDPLAGDPLAGDPLAGDPLAEDPLGGDQVDEPPSPGFSSPFDDLLAGRVDAERRVWESACGDRRIVIWVLIVLGAGGGLALLFEGSAAIGAARRPAGGPPPTVIRRRSFDRGLFLAGGFLVPVALLATHAGPYVVPWGPLSAALTVVAGAAFAGAAIRNRVEVVEDRVRVVRLLSQVECARSAVTGVRPRFLRAPACLELTEESAVTVTSAITRRRTTASRSEVAIPGGISTHRIAAMLGVALHPPGRRA